MSSSSPEAQRSSSEIHWWKDVRSTHEIAERLARSHVDKQQLEQRITELITANTLLKIECSAAVKELSEERLRNHADELLHAELASLKVQLREAEQHAQEAAGAGRREAESVARERLLRDEFERKIEALQVELNKERQRAAHQIEEMKARLAGCICGDVRIEHKVEGTQSDNSALPKRWMIRNSR
jgi:hypothetical protein